jgi:eukaryotic-like serine/threonine-protein kinase
VRGVLLPAPQVRAYVSSVPPLRPRLQAALTGRYVLERELGRGGMAIVFLARDLRNVRPVALKVLRPELAAELGPERFLQEIKIAAGLTHPHILPLYDSGEADGCLYYVMPYVAGESLRERLDHETSLHAETAIRLAREIADALHYAHEAGIIHRDIKPENILLAAGHAVVADFGISRAVYAAGGRLTQSGLAVGTPDYMSPEQAAGADDLDGRSDIYSLGCVLYEMLTGRPPERGRALSLTGLRPSVPVGLREALERALASEPARRFPTAGEFNAALSGLSAPSPPPALSRRSWAVVLGTAAVSVAVTLAWALGWRTGPKPLPAPDPTYVAVLYFDDHSPDSSLGPVAAGLTEDLIDQLGAVSALKVVSPNGVRRYRRSAVTPDSLARALGGVGTIVTGSVARTNRALRVSVRLIDAPSGRLLRSRQLERPFGDLFVLQDSLTAEIAAYLRQRIGEAVVLRQRGAGATSVPAWELVQRADEVIEGARTLLRGGDDRGANAALLEADSIYARAGALDPRWVVPATARGRVALIVAEQLAEGRSPEAARQAAAQPLRVPPRFEDEWIRLGSAHAERALGVRRGDPEALALRGALRYLRWLQGYVSAPESLAAAEADLRAAVAAAPAMARGWEQLSLLLRFTGRFAEAEEAARRALDADAFLLEARPVYATLFFAALNRGRFDDARDWCVRARARFPADVEFAQCELRILGWSGRGRTALRRAWRLLDSLEAGRPDARSGTFAADRRLLLAAIYARGGAADSARRLVAAAGAASPGDTATAWFLGAAAYVHVLAGEREAALRLLARTLGGHPQMREYVARTPWYGALHDDPRFAALVGPGR